MKRSAACWAILLLFASCGGGAAPEIEQEPAPEPAAASPPAEPWRSVDWSEDLGTATVSGRVRFVRRPPAPAPLDMSADPKCESNGAVDESLVVRDGGLANCIVSVSKGLERYRFGEGSGVVELEQRGCRYVPHVVVLQAGQTLRVVNRDDTVHNVHLYSKRNQAYGRAHPGGPVPLDKVMSRKDKLFPIRCDMHSWMSAHAEVFDHPFFTISDGDGAFTLPQLPAGTYTIAVEHEVLGKRELEVTVEDGATATVDVAFP